MGEGGEGSWAGLEGVGHGDWADWAGTERKPGDAAVKQSAHAARAGELQGKRSSGRSGRGAHP